MQSSTHSVVVIRILRHFPGGIRNRDQDVIAGGDVIDDQVLAGNVGCIDIRPSGRDPHHLGRKTADRELFWAGGRKLLLGVAKAETRFGARYDDVAAVPDEAILVELSHVEMVMRQMIVEEVGSLHRFAANKISVSDVFRDEIEAQQVVCAVRDASVLHFGVLAHVAELDGKVADVGGEVRPGRNERDGGRDDGGNECSGFHNDGLYARRWPVARNGFKNVRSNLIWSAREWRCRQ